MAAAPWQPWLEAARALHRRVPVVMPYLEYYGYDSLFAAGGGAQCDLEKLDAAGLRCFGIAVANGGGPPLAIGPEDCRPAGDADWALARLRRLYDAAMKEVRRCPRVRVVGTAAELQPTPGDARIGVIPLVTSHLWMRDLAAIDELFARGLRISHCAGETWCRSYPVIKVNGQLPPVLSEFGREVVARMNELGMVLDVAHLSDESTDAIVAASNKPVIDGHTGSRTVIPHGRGHRDGTLRRIADRGGVVGIHFADHLFAPRVWGSKYPLDSAGPNPLWQYHADLFTRTTDPEERMRLRKDRREQGAFFLAHGLAALPPPSTARLADVSDMAEHVVHLVNVMGRDHVGLGGDINGISADQWPLGMDHLGELPRLTAELLRRGWVEDDLIRFLSGNWLRVFGEVLPQPG